MREAPPTCTRTILRCSSIVEDLTTPRGLCRRQAPRMWVVGGTNQALEGGHQWERGQMLASVSHVWFLLSFVLLDTVQFRLWFQNPRPLNLSQAERSRSRSRRSPQLLYIQVCNTIMAPPPAQLPTIFTKEYVRPPPSASRPARRPSTYLPAVSQMEFCPRTLQQVLEGPPVKEEDAWQILRGILSGGTM